MIPSNICNSTKRELQTHVFIVDLLGVTALQLLLNPFETIGVSATPSPPGSYLGSGDP